MRACVSTHCHRRVGSLRDSPNEATTEPSVWLRKPHFNCVFTREGVSSIGKKEQQERTGKVGIATTADRGRPSGPCHYPGRWGNVTKADEDLTLSSLL